LAVEGFDGVRYGVLQAGEVGDHLVDARDLENAQDSGGRYRQQQRTTRGKGPLVPIHQDTKPGGVTEPGPGHVDHERPGPVRGRLQQRRPQPGSIRDVDLLRHRHDKHTPASVNFKHRSHLPGRALPGSAPGRDQSIDRGKKLHVFFLAIIVPREI
jgi:hypothetical protein